MNRLGERLLLVVGFVAVAAIVSWPQARFFATSAPEHQDVFFNMWRLEWTAHALRTSAHWLDGNIFYPELRTLTYSDAMPVEGLLAAPMLWAGLRPMLVHNVMIFSAMVASGLAMFALVRRLTGSRGAGILSGLAFAYAPYRFDHVMHMELQWVMWSPLALLFLHRLIRDGGVVNGLVLGAMMALQMLSSIYYGMYLATLVAVAAALMLVANRGEAFRRSVVPLTAGAVLAAALVAAYALPYLKTRDAIGERSEEQVAAFSARPSSYLVATPDNLVWGGMLRSRGRQERRLFPGAAVTLLAFAGLLLRRPSKTEIIYLLLFVTAFEMSLGFTGHIYGWLFTHVPAYRGLRAAARLGVFSLLFLSVLGGFGYNVIASTLGRRERWVLTGVLAALMVLEYRVDMRLSDYPNTAPPVYRALASLPRGIVAELPVPRLNQLPAREAEYTYTSTFTWFPLVNGYSGAYPASYLKRLERLEHFPDERSLRQLTADQVRYVIVHEGEEQRGLIDAVRATGRFAEVGAFTDAAGGTAHLYFF